MEEGDRVGRELRTWYLNQQATSNRRGRTVVEPQAARNDGSRRPEDILRSIRTERHQSWRNLRKAVRALMDQPHEPFGTRNVEASSKSTVRRMQEKTRLPLDRLKTMLDSM